MWFKGPSRSSCCRPLRWPSLPLAQEYDVSPEGRFVKALDKLDMLLQARRYAEAQGVNTEEFVASALAALDGEWAGLAGESP